jgi:hypothetical protein
MAPDPFPQSPNPRKLITDQPSHLMVLIGIEIIRRSFVHLKDIKGSDCKAYWSH